MNIHEIKSKRIEIYNANLQTLYISPLSSNQQEYSGRIIHSDNEFDNISLIRLIFDMDFFDFLSRPFYIFGKKVNLSSYFSAYQFQSGIVDIPMEGKLNELELKIPLKYREFCQVQIFSGISMKCKTYILPEKEIYVVINNTSSKSHEVNLIDLAQGKNLPDGVTIENSDFRIEDGKENEFKLMRIWSNNHNQVTEPVYYNETKIEVMNYFSAHSFQNRVMDVPYKFIISPSSEIKVNIASNTKVMYHLL
jgi:hypothetical protein